MSRVSGKMVITAALVAAFTLSPAMAQRGRSNARGPGGANFLAPGTRLPDIKVFDEDGQEFSTKTLREHYSVLVFGCLT